jgi:hypothetical protein
VVEPEDASSRDVNALMNEFILEIVDVEGDIVPPVEAWNLVTKLIETDPELLSAWLHLHAKSFIAEHIRFHLKSARSRARSRATSAAFGESARRFAATGDTAELAGWMNVRYFVDSQSTQRRLGDMTREDLLFVASHYDRTARSALLEEAFTRALAAQVGSRTVAEVFTEEQISEMYRSFRGRTNVAAS